MLMQAERSALLVVDVQERLAPAMTGIETAVDNVSVLLRAAARLSVPRLVSEQYPRGLGRTLPGLAELADAPPIEKLTFSCLGEDAFAERLHGLGRTQVVVAGIEAHVCVLQTAMDLLARGVEVFVVADATASRSPDNHALALSRMREAGAAVVATEMVVFEWLGRAGTDEFKELSTLIK